MYSISSDSVFVNKRNMSSSLRYVVLIVLVLVLSTVISSTNSRIRHKSKFTNVQWTYQCDEGCCRKRQYTGVNIPVSLATCNMLCDLCIYPQLWPLPKSFSADNKLASPLLIDNIKFSGVPEGSMLADATKIFLQNLRKLSGSKQKTPFQKVKTYMTVNLVCSHCDDSPLTLETDESYDLNTRAIGSNISANIVASNFYGMRHGLETLSQLIWWDTYGDIWRVLTDVYIQDKPAFPYRGVMIDTARNYFNMRRLKKVVNGMGASKLNTLHLHLTDTQSFPIEIPGLLDMAKFGSYDQSMVYTQEDINGLRKYALRRGVRLVLEVDAPGHVNVGWASNLTMCASNPMDEGQLNPDNPEALTVLEKIYQNLIELSGQNEIFHIGGDEVDTQCWRQAKAASGFPNMLYFQVHYMNQMIEKLKLANKGAHPKKIVLWSSQITDTSLLDFLVPKENIVVQYWLGNILNILGLGHSVIYSTVSYWYLDCGFGPWKSHDVRGSCDPYKSWRTVYKYRPWITHNTANRTLGGEVCLWSELVDDDLEIKLWPRASAFAERMWTDTERLTDDVFIRLGSHREVLQSRGIKVAGLWPRWCTQNPGIC